MKQNAGTCKVVMQALGNCAVTLDLPAPTALERRQLELRIEYARERTPTPLEIHTRHANKYKNNEWYQACDLDADIEAGAAPVRSRLKPREPTELEKSEVLLDRGRMFNRIRQMRAADKAQYGVTRDSTRLLVITEAALLGIRVGPAPGDDIPWLSFEPGLPAPRLPAPQRPATRPPTVDAPRPRGRPPAQAAQASYAPDDASMVEAVKEHCASAARRSSVRKFNVHRISGLSQHHQDDEEKRVWDVLNAGVPPEDHMELGDLFRFIPA
jgi:hypothetical protein